MTIVFSRGTLLHGVGWLVGWLVGWSVGRSVGQQASKKLFGNHKLLKEIQVKLLQCLDTMP